MTGTTQDQALTWVTKTVGQLREAWDSGLEVDAWEAMRSPLFVKALERHRGSPARLPLRARLRQKIRGLVGPRRGSSASGIRGQGDVRRADVVFWPTEISHVRCQLPVAAAMSRLGSSSLFLASKPSVMSALVAGGAEPLDTGAAWGQALDAARATAVRRARLLRKQLPPVLPSHGDRSLADVTGAALDLLPAVAEAVTVADNAFAECGARVLVVGNDLTLEGRSASLLARTRGVPTACLMHGAVSGSPLQAHHLTDRFLAYGNASRDILVGLGFPEARIAVVGAPHVAAARPAADTHPAIRRLLDLAPGAPWVLVATSGPGHSVSEASHQRLVRALAAIASRHPELKLLAKLHRKDRESYYVEATREAKGLAWVPAGTPGVPDDIADWLPGCSLLVTGASTAAVDALLWGVPVMTVDFDGDLGAADFIEAGTTLHVRDEAGLERELAKGFPRGYRRPPLEAARLYLENSFAARGSQAAERAAAALVGLFNGSAAA